MTGGRVGCARSESKEGQHTKQRRARSRSRTRCRRSRCVHVQRVQEGAESDWVASSAHRIAAPQSDEASAAAKPAMRRAPPPRHRGCVVSCVCTMRIRAASLPSARVSKALSRQAPEGPGAHQARSAYSLILCLARGARVMPTARVFRPSVCAACPPAAAVTPPSRRGARRGRGAPCRGAARRSGCALP